MKKKSKSTADYEMTSEENFNEAITTWYKQGHFTHYALVNGFVIGCASHEGALEVCRSINDDIGGFESEEQIKQMPATTDELQEVLIGSLYSKLVELHDMAKGLYRVEFYDMEGNFLFELQMNAPPAEFSTLELDAAFELQGITRLSAQEMTKAIQEHQVFNFLVMAVVMAANIRCGCFSYKAYLECKSDILPISNLNSSVN